MIMIGLNNDLAYCFQTIGCIRQCCFLPKNGTMDETASIKVLVTILPSDGTSTNACLASEKNVIFLCRALSQESQNRKCYLMGKKGGRDKQHAQSEHSKSGRYIWSKINITYVRLFCCQVGGRGRKNRITFLVIKMNKTCT